MTSKSSTSSPTIRLQHIQKHFSTPTPAKMPENNNDQFEIANLFDVKGKVSLLHFFSGNMKLQLAHQS